MSSSGEKRRAARRRAPRWLKHTLVAALLILTAIGVTIGVLAYRVASRFTTTRPAPESATGLSDVQMAVFERAAVVAGHPEAARAGWAVLSRGGSAADAAVAVQLVLGLVEPQSSGLGGGGFLLYYDASERRVHAYDGRETAPSGASSALFLDEDGDPLSFPAALLGGRSVGVPGIVRLLELAQRRHGRLAWKELFSDAIRLAEGGFEVTPRLARLIRLDPILPTLGPTSRYFLPGGEPLDIGEVRHNPAYAKVLRALRDEGPRAFYEGFVAHDIVGAVRSAVRPSLARGLLNLLLFEVGLDPGGSADIAAQGELSVADLASYRALEREPVCRVYRSYRVCGMPPPSGGGVAILQALALLEPFDLSKLDPLSADALHLLAEVGRLVDADREAWIGDPAHVPVPTEGLLSDAYLAKRARLVALERKLEEARPGTPPGALRAARSNPAREVPSTTHFSIVDEQGDVVASTSSIEFGFGSHTFVDGFLLNNQLTDFSFEPRDSGLPHVNTPAPNKRPRSSMSPTLVFDAPSGRFVAAVGSPGGSRIVGYVLQTLVALLDWGLSPQQAVNLPHVVAHGSTTELEDVGWPSQAELETRVDALEQRGHDVRVGQQNSGLHVIRASSAGGFETGVDPRREGDARGK